ncbi:phage baseplate assembly protein V [Pseudomonas sp. HPB0071]|uniref:phage baseplate assembly protein V n=1 Tax=Pseudomonas sp. HPB0071 TaxID=1203578 RepID=UPI0002CB02C8|nr:phage baseplate assembly protein V [Pseudomonas sp. HPB0071]ENA26304.1 phage baseplate assembly protein V [Pseudomonas sp. HPB0071]
MNEYAALSRLIENLIRLGTVSEVDYGSLENNRPPRLRVQSGELLTGWLPWFALRAGADRTWDPPTVGEQVVLFSPSGLTEQGIALTGLCSLQYPANADRAGLHRRTYADGAVIEYDSVAHRLRAILPEAGITDLTSPGGINIIGPINHQGDYTQTGNQNVTGTVTVSKDVIAAGISLVKHPHGNVEPGSGQSGAPLK